MTDVENWMEDVSVDANGWATEGPCLLELESVGGTVVCVSHTVSEIMNAVQGYDAFDPMKSPWFQITAGADGSEDIGRRTVDFKLTDVSCVNYAKPEWVHKFETEI